MLINMPVLPIEPFNDTAKNWKCENMYGRCMLIISDVTFTDDFGTRQDGTYRPVFAKGDTFAELQIDLNNGSVTAWRTRTLEIRPCSVRCAWYRGRINGGTVSLSIDTLIEKLTKIRSDYGNVEVFIQAAGADHHQRIEDDCISVDTARDDPQITIHGSVGA